MMGNIKIAFGLLVLFGLPKSLFAQSEMELESCMQLIEEFCGAIPAESPYVKVCFRAGEKDLLEDFDRGWVIKKSDESITILNDRLLVREYSTRISETNQRFEVASCDVEPLSRMEHSTNIEKRKKIAERYSRMNSAFQDELIRYPYFAIESSRLVHYVIQSRTLRYQISVLPQSTTSIDFESAYYFRINGCAYDQRNSWGENARCAFGNCFLTQTFTKISDPKRVSIEECIAQTNKLLKLIDSGVIRCDRIIQLQDAQQKLLTWKKEKFAIESRLLFFPTRSDKLLNFLMSVGNIPGERATILNADDLSQFRRIWSEKVDVDLCKTYLESSIPTRHVVAYRGQEPSILTVGQLLEIFGPQDSTFPK